MQRNNICIQEGCETMAVCRHMCQMHYNASRRYNRKNNPNIARCSIDECDSPILARSWCAKHYDRWFRNGDPLINFGVLGDDAVSRFWQRVKVTADDSRCWEYPIQTKGDYPKVYMDGRAWKASRFVWFLTHGYETNMLIRHTCDNTHCVNPNHLLEGTHWDNSQDAIERERNARGEKHAGAKLTDIKVGDIKRALQTGATHKSLAIEYGVARTAITSIARGKTWKHVE